MPQPGQRKDAFQAWRHKCQSLQTPRQEACEGCGLQGAWRRTFLMPLTMSGSGGEAAMRAIALRLSSPVYACSSRRSSALMAVQ